MKYVSILLLLLLIHPGMAWSGNGQGKRAATVQSRNATGGNDTAGANDRSRNGTCEMIGKRAAKQGTVRDDGGERNKREQSVDRFSDRDGDGINDCRESCPKNCSKFKEIEERRTKRK